jgi:mutator protein MutT
MGGAGEKSAQNNGPPEWERDGRISTGDGADTRPSNDGCRRPDRPATSGGVSPHRVGTRVEYFHDPSAPRPTVLVPVAFAVVRDDRGRVLLCRRADTGNWEIPGGSVEAGESALDAVQREVEEETGVLIAVTGASGIYTDPEYVIAYPTGEVRQQFAVCLHARPTAGAIRPDCQETAQVGWIRPDHLDRFPIHPGIRVRLDAALTDPDHVHLA